MKYAREPLVGIWDDIMALANAHWNETEEYRHGQQFSPDKSRYLYLESIGFYHQFTAREGDVLAGYGGIYVMPSMHTQKMVASEDTYFLLPEYRKGRNAIGFLRFIEDYLQGLGCIEFMVSTKLSNPKAERIIEYLKFQFVEKRWSKHYKEQSHVRISTSSACSA